MPRKHLSLIITLLLSAPIFSQTLTLSFSALSADSIYTPLDSVQISDLSQSWSQTIIFPDTLLTLTPSPNSILSPTPLSVSLPFPNPAQGRTSVRFSTPSPQHVALRLCSLQGTLLAQYSALLPAGSHSADITISPSSPVLLQIISPSCSRTIKIINTHPAPSSSISLSSSPLPKAQCSHPSSIGDLMRYTAFASFNNEQYQTSISQPLASSELILFSLPFLLSSPDTAQDDSDGLLPGIFSVAENSFVQFSKGNLQFRTSGSHLVASGDSVAGTWHFASSQYSCLGAQNDNISPSYPNYIDLFGWGTSGWSGGASAYQPFSTSSLPSDYCPSDNPSANLAGDYAYADWGQYNAISNGGNIPSFWRTLSNDEWDYLLGSSPARANKYAAASILVDSVSYCGIILLPDNFSLPDGCSFSPGCGSGFSTNSYSLEQWGLMESSGAVFLPAAGYRAGTATAHIGSWGCYWSSSAYSSTEAHGLQFRSTAISPIAIDSRDCGRSVRLVHPIE